MTNEPAASGTPYTNLSSRPLEILLDDGPLIALNKPAGLLTQGVPHAQASMEGLVKAYLKTKLDKPGNVYLGVPHRLDRPVSGVVIFAKNSKAAARLAEQFRERSLRKIYLAVTEGVPDPAEGCLVDWLFKDAEDAHVTVVPAGTPGAKRAVLDYQVLAVHQGRALVEVELHTGRMHQIRVQFGSRGWPIADDRQYGSKSPATLSDYDPRVSPIGLHAWRLHLRHPVRYDALRLEAPLPANWSRFGFKLPKGI
ncbi:RluA family pseudouridine synthase [Schlesneria paludicola]|uniref:RluA family pseudouridine synthase n=1 Tax=Schlesneria paludicola TaxID=360056 RepID=UPI00029B198B|nr:RNA pseudouridine synthase [Schlesneria paludicola]